MGLTRKSSKLDLTASGITNLIWATGYSFDFSLVKLPVTDQDGFPIQTRGVSAYPGLFFVGLPWLHTARSGLMYGLAEDARYIADRIAERRAAIEAASIVPLPGRSLRPSQLRATTRWADRVNTLIWSSALSLMLDGFAGYAAGIYPTAQQASPHQANFAIAPTDAPSGQR
jgi:putative flavoprotein involved in K+ transport